MVVIDHAPHAWFLLRDGDGFVLDVNCEVAAVGFSLILRLDPDEAADVAARGRVAAAALAGEIAGSPRKYAPRHGGAALAADVEMAIRAWRDGPPGG